MLAGDLEQQRADIEAQFRRGWVARSRSGRMSSEPRERRPLIRGVSDDAEVIITGTGPARVVAMLFSHERFPGMRFGHRVHAG